MYVWIPNFIQFPCCTQHCKYLTTHYTAFHQHFGSDVTSGSFAINWSRRHGAMLVRAARRYATAKTRNKHWFHVTWLPKCLWMPYSDMINLFLIYLPQYSFHSVVCMAAILVSQQHDLLHPCHSIWLPSKWKMDKFYWPEHMRKSNPTPHHHDLLHPHYSI